MAVAHPARDGSAAWVVAGDVDAAAASMEAFAPGDGDAWRRLMRLWDRAGEHLLDALFTPFPPVKPGARLARALGPRGMLDFARFGLLPVRRLGTEEFSGEGGPRLLSGNALHADLSPEQPGSGMYGWVLCGLAQNYNFPVVRGGSSGLIRALVRRLEARGGRVTCDARVARVPLRGGRAVAVRTADGREVEARRAVLADVSAPALFLELVGRDALPGHVLAGLERFEWGNATFKVDWALSGPIPWLHPEVARAGTVHIAESVDALSRATMDTVLRRLPAEPFLVAGQYARYDPSRQPAGAETLWAYTHVPQDVEGDAGDDELTGDWDDPREREALADRMERQVEGVAPGFRELVLDRHITAPPDFTAQNANLPGGALNGGTAQLHQQLVFRPVPGLGRPETPIAGLYLASNSAHPGGGVHGACGSIAARAALRERGPARRGMAALSRGISGRA